MKLSVNLIKQFHAVNLPATDLVEAIGMQVGAVESVVELSEQYEYATVVKVVDCKPHPNADRLSVCLIEDGGKTEDVERDKDGFIQVVCGAPNVAKGLMVVWLPPGSIVPLSFNRDQQKITSLEIRGVISNGMLASAKELAISEDHSGILVVDLPSRPGMSFANLYELNDTIIEIENKMLTHRPDLFGHLGLAREIAGITHEAFTSPSWYLNLPKESFAKGNLKVEIKNELTSLVPRFMAQVISGVSIGPSDIKLQSYLTRLGLKPINNVVDQTNYAMVITGQPFHAYDFDKLARLDNSLSTANLVVRHPKKDENLTLINGKKVIPEGQTIGIASKSQLIGLGGVMGGSDTEIDESTTNVILEAAVFDMNVIRRTAMSIGVFSDAVTRFTKGISPEQTDRSLAYLAKSLTKTAGGQPSAPVDTRTNLEARHKVDVGEDFINNRLGSKLSIQTIAELLKNVEFAVSHTNQLMKIQSPFWRTDIQIPEDIIEEIGRLYGYQNLSIELPKRVLVPAVAAPHMDLKRKIREQLESSGANELLTYSFVHGDLLGSAGQDRGLAYQIQNAISPDLQYYRLSLLPSLLERVHSNIKSGHDKFAIFEMNPVHQKNRPDSDEPGLPKEDHHLAFVFAANDKLTGKSFFGAPYYQTLNYLTHLLTYLGISTELKPLNPTDTKSSQLAKLFETDRSATVMSGKSVLGIVGEPNQLIKQKLKLPNYVSMFEIGTAELIGLTGGNPYRRLSQYPPVDRDMTFKVRAALNFGELSDLLRKQLAEELGKDFVYKLDCIDIYMNKTDAKFKNVTFHLSVSSYLKTLTSEEANEIITKLARHAKTKLEAELV